MREKYRICQEDSAVKFLTAMKYKEDDVFLRCADLDTPEKVFAADLYCHNECFKQYITLPKDQDSTESPTNNPKQEFFLKAVSHLDPMLRDGYGFTMTEVKEFVFSFSENNDFEIYNRDVKKFLTDHYGDQIQFCPSHRANEPEMCFSSALTVNGIAAKMRDMNVVKTCGEILREVLKKVDFKLDDKFCDGHDLKQSWETTAIPDQLLTYFFSLFEIKRSRMLKIEMIGMLPEDENAQSQDDDDCPYSSTPESNQHPFAFYSNPIAAIYRAVNIHRINA